MRIRRSSLREVYEPSYIVEHECSNESPFCGGGLRAAAGRGAGREDLPVNSIQQVMRQLSFKYPDRTTQHSTLNGTALHNVETDQVLGARNFMNTFTKTNNFVVLR